MNDDNKRFKDQHLRISDFYNEVWVHCPTCQHLAYARADHEEKRVRLSCSSCGYFKCVSTALGKRHLVMAANGYFEVELWFEAAYKGEVFAAYNPFHLGYLRDYIAAGLREHRDREHFTMLEKLPKYMQVAKNREGLLKLIDRLKRK